MVGSQILTTSQLVACHLTDGMDEVVTVQIFEPILIRVMGVRATVELMSRRVLYPVLITSILRNGQNMWNNEDKGLARYSSSLYMKGVIT